MPDADSTIAPEVAENSHVYRVRGHILHQGVVGLVYFGLLLICSMLSMLTDSDFSFLKRLVAATFFASFWSVFVLISCWLFATYSRHCVFLTPHSIRVFNILSTREVSFDEVIEANWNSKTLSGTLFLRSSKSWIGLEFGAYTYQERAELMNFIHASLPSCTEKGWEQFTKRYTPTKNMQEIQGSIQRLVRFTTIAWGLALPVVYTILIWNKLNGIDPKHGWLYIAVAPLVMPAFMVGGFWFISQGDQERRSERATLQLVPIYRGSGTAPAATHL